MEGGLEDTYVLNWSSLQLNPSEFFINISQENEDPQTDDLKHKKSSALAPPRMQSDKNNSKCQLCSQSFTLWVRRHNCRRCGAVVCKSCSKHKGYVFYVQHKVRVCNKCFQ